MKIVHIYKTYYPDSYGGVEKFIDTLAKGLQKHDIHSTLAVPLMSKEIHSSDYLKIERYNKSFEVLSCPFSFPMLHHYRKLVASFDLIHYHFPWPFADIMHLLNFVKQPSVITYHSDIVKQKKTKMIYTPIMNAFFSKASKILATSPNYIETSQTLTDHKDKVDVIPLGLDPSQFASFSPQQSDAWKQRIGGEYVLFVGVLRYYKGLRTLVKAMQQTKNRLVIAGGGPEHDYLNHFITKHKLDHVHLVGRVSESDKHALLANCKALVLPSNHRSEAFGLSLLEGMAYGKPLISTELGTGTTFVNKHEQTGWVVAPENPHQLSHAINQLFNDDTLAKQYGKAALEHFNQLFHADLMCKQYAALYHEIVTNREKMRLQHINQQP